MGMLVFRVHLAAAAVDRGDQVVVSITRLFMIACAGLSMLILAMGAAVWLSSSVILAAL